MAAGKLDIVIEQGSTFRKKLTWADNINYPDAGSPIDITGYTAAMHIREELESTTILVELTDSNGRIVIGGANGEIDLFIDAADTAALDSDITQGVYDLEIKAPGVGGDTTRLAEGTWTLSLEVTR